MNVNASIHQVAEAIVFEAYLWHNSLHIYFRYCAHIILLSDTYLHSGKGGKFPLQKQTQFETQKCEILH